MSLARDRLPVTAANRDAHLSCRRGRRAEGQDSFVISTETKSWLFAAPA